MVHPLFVARLRPRRLRQLSMGPARRSLDQIGWSRTSSASLTEGGWVAEDLFALIGGSDQQTRCGLRSDGIVIAQPDRRRRAAGWTRSRQPPVYVATVKTATITSGMGPAI